jgi:hypothetical protein
MSIFILPLFVACQDQSVGLGKGPELDARLVADMYTWRCNGDDGDTYEGVFTFEVWLEYSPDLLPDRTVPSSGCASGLDLFPTSAGENAVDLEGTPSWASADYAGDLTRQSTGFYKDTAFDNQHTCQSASELLGDGTEIAGAAPFDGARTPSPGSYGDVTVSSLDGATGIPFGETVDVTWDADGWDESWVQIRRENAGTLVESVTCATSGGSYTIDDATWDTFSSVREADVTNLYVAVQRTDEVEGADGQTIQVVSRAMHVGVVAE